MVQHLKYRRAWLMATGLLLLVGIPWYWPLSTESVWLLPRWVWLSLGASVAWSALIVWAALCAWPDEDPMPDE